MRISPDDVSAIIVTRGNVEQELQRILWTLPFTDVVVWDNSHEPEDQKTYGRHLAVERCKHAIIYSQDDDLLFRQHERLLGHYEPGVLVGSMFPKWSNTARKKIPGGYDDLIFPGAGSLYDRDVCQKALDRYLEHYPLDDFFRIWCDCAVGILAPHKNVKLHHQVLDCAREDYRICRQPGASQEKKLMIERAREIRDGRFDKV